MKGILKRFSVTLTAIVVLMIVAALLIVDNVGSHYSITQNLLNDLPQSVVSEKKRKSEVEATCLLLLDSSQENFEVNKEHLTDVMHIMRVSCDIVDLATEEIPDFYGYKTSVIGFPDLDALRQKSTDLLEWVQDGGRCMLFCAPAGTPTFYFLSNYMGVREGGNSYADFAGLTITNDFMIGGNGFNFHWGEPMTTAINCLLNEKAVVYATSDDKSKIPLIWKADCGKGRFAIMNTGMCEKATRGITCAVYSLLEDACVYPVINASSFCLDDFPSPVPMGDGTYIRRDYKRDIKSFYSNVWWPDVLALSDKYGIKFTGLLIDDYAEEVDGSFPQQRDTERFTHFGSLLLNNGGEIGLHGYNHLPLCFNGFDFKGKVNYKTWKTEEDALTSLNRAIDLNNSLFPDNEVSVYVPPSNILSAEGRQLLHDQLPQIKVIASLYLPGEIEYSQEFEVSDDGIIEVPRVISGAVLDEYMRWDALNALNLYYVNTHFMHPDDVLDEDRGTVDGWAKLYDNLDNYCNWLYSSAPNIRNLTVSDTGRAVSRFDSLSIERKDSDGKINLRLIGFYDEAYLMVRCNTGEPKKVSGGQIEHISGDFYLLRATQDIVEIETGAAE